MRKSLALVMKNLILVPGIVPAIAGLILMAVLAGLGFKR